MAISRRQFVGTLGALAAAAGIGQAELSSITEAFAHSAPWNANWTSKPKVVWIHGAECTGCSTSLLSFFEDARGTAIEDTTDTTAYALDLAVGGDGTGAALLNTQATNPEANHPFGHRTLHNAAAVTMTDPDGEATNSAYAVNIADVLIDIISLEYHETVMAMGGDLAYEWLKNAYTDSTDFVLVVEGAVQDKTLGGYWNKTGSTSWCSIGADGKDGVAAETSFDDAVLTLSNLSNCLAIIAIGQCATYGGYPACHGGLDADAQHFGYDITTSQTGAVGVAEFLTNQGSAAAAKVINVPGCPTNPWWFVLTVVAWLVDAVTGPLASPAADGALGILDSHFGIKSSAVDTTGRLKAVYGYPVHSGRCPRFNYYSQGIYAQHPGDVGCLLMVGCKGPMTKSLCPRHGWNNQQPQNAALYPTGTSLQTILDSSVQATKTGGYCVASGHPCMGCTEKGYPDVFTPYVVNR